MPWDGQPVALYKCVKACNSDGTSYQLYPVVGARLAKEAQFSLASSEEVDERLLSHAGATFRWTMLRQSLPTTWLLERLRDTDDAALAELAVNKHSPPTPTGVGTSYTALVMEEDADEEVEVYDLFS